MGVSGQGKNATEELMFVLNLKSLVGDHQARGIFSVLKVHCKLGTQGNGRGLSRKAPWDQIKQAFSARIRNLNFICKGGKNKGLKVVQISVLKRSLDNIIKGG